MLQDIAGLGFRFRKGKLGLCGGIHQFNAHDLNLYLVIGTFGLDLDLGEGVLEVHGNTGTLVDSLSSRIVRDHKILLICNGLCGRETGYLL